MSTITHIPRALIEQGQRRKELTANEALMGIALRTVGAATIDLTGETATATLAGLTVGVARVIRLESAGESLTLLWPLDATYSGQDPTPLAGEWLVINASGFDHTIQAVAGSAAVSIANRESRMIRFDGVEVYPIGGAYPTGYAGRYLAQVSNAGTLGNGEVSDDHVVMVPAILPAGASGSFGTAEIAPAANATFSIQKNGVEIATATFAAAATVASFVAAAAIAFVPGDRLRVVGPDPSDASLSNFAIQLQLLRV